MEALKVKTSTGRWILHRAQDLRRRQLSQAGIQRMGSRCVKQEAGFDASEGREMRRYFNFWESQTLTFVYVCAWNVMFGSMTEHM